MRSIAGWNHGTSTTLPRSMQRAVRYGPETATLGSRASKLNRLCRTDVRQVRLNTLVSAFIAASCHWKRYSIVATCGQSLPFSIDFLWIMLASWSQTTCWDVFSGELVGESTPSFCLRPGELQLCCRGWVEKNESDMLEQKCVCSLRLKIVDWDASSRSALPFSVFVAMGWFFFRAILKWYRWLSRLFRLDLIPRRQIFF